MLLEHWPAQHDCVLIAKYGHIWKRRFNVLEGKREDIYKVTEG